LTVIVSSAEQRVLRWTFFSPDFGTGCAKRGWRSSKDLNRERDIAWYLIGSLSEGIGTDDRFRV
jgi:hypothetical protein